MTAFLQVVLSVVAGVVLVFGLAVVVGGWLRRVQPPPFDRCDDPDCGFYDDEEVGS